MKAANTYNKRMQTSTLISNLSSGLLILLFAYTGISKLISRGQFQATIDYSPILRGYGTILSWTIPAIELILVLLLLLAKTRRAGFVLSAILLASFTAYIIYILINVPAKDIPCSCGGVINVLTWKAHIALNIFFIIISLSGFNYSRNQQRQLSHNPP